MLDPRSTLEVYKKNKVVYRIYRYSGLTIKEMSKELNIRSDKLLEFLGFLIREGAIKDIEFC